jgi:hypothetical protein
MTLYLKDTTYIDWQTLEFQSAHLAVAPGVDGNIQLLDKLPSQAQLNTDDSVLDCHHRLVTKSFVCGQYATTGESSAKFYGNPGIYLVARG